MDKFALLFSLFAMAVSFNFLRSSTSSLNDTKKTIDHMKVEIITAKYQQNTMLYDGRYTYSKEHLLGKYCAEKNLEEGLILTKKGEFTLFDKVGSSKGTYKIDENGKIILQSTDRDIDGWEVYPYLAERKATGDIEAILSIYSDKLEFSKLYCRMKNQEKK